MGLLSLMVHSSTIGPMERSILALLILLLPLHGTAQSISVGTPQEGHLQNGAELALSSQGVHPKTRKRDYRYGIPSLIQLIQDLGAYSVKEHQTQLFVGNLQERREIFPKVALQFRS